MNQQEKKREAAEIVRLAIEAGCKIENTGSWTTYKPPLPIDLMMRAMDVSDEIAELVRVRNTPLRLVAKR